MQAEQISRERSCLERKKIMKLVEYLKDRITELILAAAALGVTLLFLYAFRVSWILMALIAAVFLVFGAVCIVWDYMRKRDFYSRLNDNLSGLSEMNQGYLAAATLEEPDFYEGRILYNALCTMGKSMTEQVSASHQSVTDFKEYVEMWVHEAKLPIASLLLKQYNFKKTGDGSLSSLSDGEVEVTDWREATVGCRTEGEGTEKTTGGMEPVGARTQPKDGDKPAGEEMETMGGGEPTVRGGITGESTKDSAERNLDEKTWHQIRKQLLKLDAYTDQILYYTRSEVAEKDFLIKECLLSRLFSKTASRMREELQENGFDIRAEHLDVVVLTDGKWLEFILNQLISNSIKYRAADRDPELRVWAEELPDRTDLKVWDNGIGIPQKDLPRIFEKSFTGENGRCREKSTGMGLYIARKLCDKLGHSINVVSVQGEFTEFTISFAKNDFYNFKTGDGSLSYCQQMCGTLCVFLPVSDCKKR